MQDSTEANSEVKTTIEENSSSSQPTLKFTPRVLLSYLEEIAAILVLLVILLVVLIGVFQRYVIGNPLTWTTPLATYSLVWLTFLGSAIAVKRKRHLDIDILGSVLPARAGAFITITSICLEVVVFAGLLLFGFQLAANTSSPTTVPDLSMSHVYAAVPTGAALMLLHALKRLLYEVRGVQ